LSAAAAAQTPDQSRMPPVTEIGAGSMVLVASGVIYLAAYLPKRAPLWLAVVFLAGAALLLFTNVVLLSRLQEFAWRRFFEVSRWALAAYIVIAGMIEYAFVYDHTRGRVLVVMTLLLVTFTLNVPILIAFTVARFQAAREL
jgi:hypothetical protein